MTEMVSYRLDDGTEVEFEVDPDGRFRPAGVTDALGRVRDAVRPAVAAAHVVLDQLKDAAPDEIGVKFGIKVTGANNWIIAKSSVEGSFEVTMTWRPEDRSTE